MNLDNPVFTFGIALAGGMIAQVLAQHLRMPGIVLLLLFGVLLGPDLANVVRPETLGTGLRLTVGMAVAVILFEGGLHLDIHRLRGEAVTIRRLVTIGAAVTAVGGRPRWALLDGVGMAGGRAVRHLGRGHRPDRDHPPPAPHSDQAEPAHDPGSRRRPHRPHRRHHRSVGTRDRSGAGAGPGGPRAARNPDPGSCWEPGSG